MRYIKIGNTSIKASVVGLGTWAIGGWAWGGTNEKESVNAINAAFDSGINFIDTAPIYGKGISEKIIGKAIKGKRDKFVLGTKCGMIWHQNYGEFAFDYESTGEKIYKYLGKESIEYELNNSLKRLETDYIDLYQTHWPDKTTPIEETMSILKKLKEQGKIRAIGVCNVSLKELKEYQRYGILDSDQEKYNLLDREIENDTIPWCKGNNVTVISYSSFSRGILTGKIKPNRKFTKGDHRIGRNRYSRKNIIRINNLIDDYLKPIANRHKCSIGNIATAWILRNPGVIALCGVRDHKQAIENSVGANIKLNDFDFTDINNFINKYKEN